MPKQRNQGWADRIANLSNDDLIKLDSLIQAQLKVRGLDRPPWEASGELKKQDMGSAMFQDRLSDKAPFEGPGGVSELVHIWVDGSFDKKSKAYSYGMVIESPDGDDKFYARRFPEDGASGMNNVAGELAGARAALDYACDHKIGSIVIHHDYTGIGEWADGHWRAKNPYTQAYQSLVSGLRSQGMKIEFRHVSGHTGVAQNEKCDELAKHVLGIELSRDYKVQAAEPYQSRAEKSATIQSAIAKAASDYGFAGEQMQI